MSHLLRYADRHYQGMKSVSHHPRQWSGGSWLLLGILVLSASLGLSATEALAQDYQITVVASNLARPTGITASALGDSDNFYYTELPQPGIGQGSNTVSRLTLSTGTVTALNTGDPEPTNVVQDAQGNLYWTCHSAGVIKMQTPDGTTSILVQNLQQPVGIALDAAGLNLYFTEVPTPGVSGSNGGMNQVSQLDLTTLNRTVLDAGDPEPTNIVVAVNGDLYWTCKSAGVIVRRAADTADVSIVRRSLLKPTGIALDPAGENLYYTEVWTPGVRGKDGGHNFVSKFNLQAQTTTLIHFGDPEPTAVTVAANGNIYWTCTSAGVIVEAKVLN
jgi:sugar lactone lactonase YvrE